MKRMIKISVIVVDVLVLAYYLVVFVIPKYDPMYLPADEHRQKNSINSQYDEEGVRGLSKAVQGIKGTYFVYKSRVMFMGDADEKISEVCKMPSDIVGILEKDDTVFLRKYDDVEGIYRAYEEGEAQRLIDDPGTLYMEGDNIYTLSKKNGLRKYDFNEEKNLKTTNRITEETRTVERQNELYAIGRTTKGNIVTYAKVSSYSSHHQWGTAFDFCRNDGKDPFYDRDVFFSRVDEIGKSIGLEWGGDWEKADKPHFQLPDWGSTTKELKKRYGTPDEFEKTWY